MEAHPGGWHLKAFPNIHVDARTFKMSKSRGNVVNPDEVIADHGADALRLYEMFMGPLEQTKPWSMAGVQGVARFLARVWRLVMEEDQEGNWRLSNAVQDIEATPAQTQGRPRHDQEGHGGHRRAELQHGHRADDGVHQRVHRRHGAAPFGNPHAAATAQSFRPSSDRGTLGRAGRAFPLPARTAGRCKTWPEFDPAFLVEDEIELPVQINGKLRDRLLVKKDAAGAEIEALALASAKVQEHLGGKAPRKVIVVPGKLVNIVA